MADFRDIPLVPELQLETLHAVRDPAARTALEAIAIEWKRLVRLAQRTRQAGVELEGNTQIVSVNSGDQDHGSLSGLANDDHTQYALLAGRTGGQTLWGGTGGTDDLNLLAGRNVQLLVGFSLVNVAETTISITAVGGNVVLAGTLITLQAAGGNITIGGAATASELQFLEPSAGGTSYAGFKAPALAGNTIYTLPTAFPAATGYVLVSTDAGVQSWTNSLTSFTFITPALGTPASGTLTNCTGLPVAGGGTGAASFTAYAVICGGTTSTGALQPIASVGTAGQVLTSNGAGALPTFQAAAGGTDPMRIHMRW